MISWLVMFYSLSTLVGLYNAKFCLFHLFYPLTFFLLPPAFHLSFYPIYQPLRPGRI